MLLGGLESLTADAERIAAHVELRTAFSYARSRRQTSKGSGESKYEGCAREASKPFFLPEKPRLPLAFCARRPCSRLPRLVLLVEPAVDEAPNQGAGRDTAAEALAAQARVDAFFEAHRHRLSQGSHLRPQPYTRRSPPATDRSEVVRSSAGTPETSLRASTEHSQKHARVVGVFSKVRSVRNAVRWAANRQESWVSSNVVARATAEGGK